MTSLNQNKTNAKTSKPKVSVLVADDEKNLVNILKEELASAGFEVFTAYNGKDALKLLEQKKFDVCLLDVNMPFINGVEVLRIAGEQAVPTEFIVLTADATVSTVIEAMKLGAYDYVVKPCALERIIFLVNKANEKRLMKKESLLFRRLREGKAEFITRNTVMLKLIAEAARAARSDVNVLLMGESGTGKNLLAGHIHENSQRFAEPYISFNIAAMQATLVESELFGHEKGAFTGAINAKAGLFELADRGTIFLDEIGDVPPDVQVKLLRVIEKGAFYKVGGTREFSVDVRLLAATNRDLLALVKQGRFREDLYYRLSTVAFTIPPLRERKDDIPALVEKVTDGLPAGFKKRLDNGAMALLLRYDWPGNVRELENVLQRAAILSDGDVIKQEDLPAELRGKDGGNGGGHSASTLRDMEREHIKKALDSSGGHRKKTADFLGIDCKTLWRKIKEYELE
ncbi:MAG: sigma-54 dependent transcriptional regulator [Thermodesulfobacteriota bacterium]